MARIVEWEYLDFNGHQNYLLGKCFYNTKFGSMGQNHEFLKF
jgi:hypothetical protein